MYVLAINGSPRKKGNSEILLHAVLHGMIESGAEIEVIRVGDFNIHPCVGCGGCDKTGRCVIDDDMIGMYDRIVAARTIVFASPIYFYGITAQAKAFVDRTQTLWSRQRLPDADTSWFTDPKRQGFFLSVAATRGAKVFDGAILTMKYGFDAMGVKHGGDFLVRGVDKRGDLATFKDKLKEAEEFGRQILT